MSSRSSLPSHAHSSDTMDIFLLMRRSHQYLPPARLNAAARRPMFVAKARRYLGASSLWKIWAPYMAPMLALIAILVIVSQFLPRVLRFANSKGAFEHTLPSQVTVLRVPAHECHPCYVQRMGKRSEDLSPDDAKVAHVTIRQFGENTIEYVA